jgi:hypothetical protein
MGGLFSGPNAISAATASLGAAILQPVSEYTAPEYTVSEYTVSEYTVSEYTAAALAVSAQE